MKLESRKTKFGLALATILICSVLGVAFYFGIEGGGGTIAGGGRTLLFITPVFAQSVLADTTFLDEEAGMAIYVDIGRSIDLEVAKTVYRTIEKETVNYTVGSAALPGLPESEDVHVFVHTDGWIVAYYLEAEPIGKIVDWAYWSGGALTKNKLQVGLERMGNALGAAVTEAKYYHFQYPDANKSMLIIDTLVGTGSSTQDGFDIKVPLEFTVYERSWSHYSEYSFPDDTPDRRSRFKIDGAPINTISLTSPQTDYGKLDVAQLSLNVYHNVSVSGHYFDRLYGICIALAYQEP